MEFRESLTSKIWFLPAMVRIDHEMYIIGVIPSFDKWRSKGTYQTNEGIKARQSTVAIFIYSLYGSFNFSQQARIIR